MLVPDSKILQSRSGLAQRERAIELLAHGAFCVSVDVYDCKPGITENVLETR